MKHISFFSVFVGLAIANFSWQWLGSQDWAIAEDRTYFQGAALLMAWVVQQLEASREA